VGVKGVPAGPGSSIESRKLKVERKRKESKQRTQSTEVTEKKTGARFYRAPAKKTADGRQTTRKKEKGKMHKSHLSLQT
jgi:hypothetical protein